MHGFYVFSHIKFQISFQQNADGEESMFLRNFDICLRYNTEHKHRYLHRREGLKSHNKWKIKSNHFAILKTETVMGIESRIFISARKQAESLAKLLGRHFGNMFGKTAEQTVRKHVWQSC
jgi:hypothetical protein